MILRYCPSLVGFLVFILLMAAVVRFSNGAEPYRFELQGMGFKLTMVEPIEKFVQAVPVSLSEKLKGAPVSYFTHRGSVDERTSRTIVEYDVLDNGGIDNLQVKIFILLPGEE